MLTVSGMPLEIGPLLRLTVDDTQDIPSFKTDYSDAVPIVHASFRNPEDRRPGVHAGLVVE